MGVLIRPSSLHARYLRIAAFIGCFILTAFTLRRLVVRDDLIEDMESGTFERMNGRDVLALSEEICRELYPAIDLYDLGRQLGISPGLSIALRLPAGGSYRVDGPSAHLPFLVLGSRQQLPPGAAFDDYDPQTSPMGRPELARKPTIVIDDAVVPSIDESGHLALSRWNTGAPWMADEARLERIQQTCHGSRFDVTRQVDQVKLSIGDCQTSHSVAGSDAVLAVLGGPDGASVAKDGVWRFRSHLPRQWPAILGALLAASSLLFVGLGGRVALLTNGVLALASVFLPFNALVVWLLAFVAGVFASLARLLLALSWMSRVATCAAIAALALFALRPREANHQRVDIEGRQPGAMAQCVMTGYSTVKDQTLNYQTKGIFGRLAASCPHCQSNTVRVARDGETFDFIKKAACSDSFPGSTGSDTLFLGGSNDDFISRPDNILSAGGLRLLLTYGESIAGYQDLRKAGRMGEYRLLLNAVADNLMRKKELHQEPIRAAVECLARRGEHFWYFHDFMVHDLREGRAPSRAALLEARKQAVESAGGHFVSLFERTRDEMGISWFNDQIHLSTRAHARVAEIMCFAMEEPSMPVPVVAALPAIVQMPSR